MIRPTDFTHPNPPDDIPSPLMKQAMNVFQLPWPRKPLSAKPKPVGKPSKPSKSGLHKLKRTSHGSPFF